MRGAARIYDVRMTKFVLKLEQLSHIMGPRTSQDLWSPSLIMAPEVAYYIDLYVVRCHRRRRAFATTSNTASHFYHEKSDSRVSMSMGLRMVAAGALL